MKKQSYTVKWKSNTITHPNIPKEFYGDGGTMVAVNPMISDNECKDKNIANRLKRWLENNGAKSIKIYKRK